MLTIPRWHLAVLGAADPAEIRDLFSGLLKHMPMTTTDLASRMGVNQSTVSRWSAGQARPPLKEMVRAARIIAEETVRLNEFAREVEAALGLVEAFDEQYAAKGSRGFLKERKAREADLDGHIERAMALIGEERLEEPEPE